MREKEHSQWSDIVTDLHSQNQNQLENTMIILFSVNCVLTGTWWSIISRGPFLPQFHHKPMIQKPWLLMDTPKNHIHHPSHLRLSVACNSQRMDSSVCRTSLCMHRPALTFIQHKQQLCWIKDMPGFLPLPRSLLQFQHSNHVLHISQDKLCAVVYAKSALGSLHRAATRHANHIICN